ncbi:hypothetical protein SZ64_00885 [Erythrobacter sp. SG61-1L]|uniref:cytochrome C n=1 Tax=Erythrobacter sp. SG61-1L TaxID=1603897 RepID=UPI0006D6E24F|nr:cytochrome C [Erythrobacter sp. SG61-1L]KPL66783.1 hypothetical protein SZ64_00885 [Erythrobacter sp. SG61-1L]
MRYYLLGGASALLGAALMSPGWLAPDPARALPSYARQTGEDCAACHVGGFGPQLTPHGRDFKINGFSDGTTKIPLSGMAVANFTHTAKAREDVISDHDGRNDNVALQEASVFLAGRLAKGLGTFVQTTYSEVDRATALDHAEVRYAHPVKIAGADAVIGVDINNNPTLSDPFNSVGAWSFPYTSSDLGFEGAAAPLLQGGIEHQAVGATAFLSIADGLYAEAGGYRSLRPSLLGTFGIEAEAGSISGVAPYWRLAYSKDFGRSNASIGVIGMSAHLNPDRDGGPTDKFSDVGVDATYQFLGNRKNIVSANASYIHENQTLDHAVFAGETSMANHSLDTISGDVSWYYKKHFGLTLGGFSTTGTRDTDLFAPAAEEGSRTGKPDTAGYILQADYSPWGGEGQSTFANLRLGLQYKGYTKFNGASHDYDGSGRAASDNNTVTAFIWTAF